MIKTLNPGIERSTLNLIKGIYKKPAANIILSGEDPCFPPKIRDKIRMPILATSIHHCTDVLATEIRQEKEIKSI